MTNDSSNVIKRERREGKGGADLLLPLQQPTNDASDVAKRERKRKREERENKNRGEEIAMAVNGAIDERGEERDSRERREKIEMINVILTNRDILVKVFFLIKTTKF